MERELRLAERAGRGFALLMLDLDGLKPVNDTFGHHYGDRLLQAVTEVIQRSVRATDTPARYGGDEFVILLPDTDAARCASWSPRSCAGTSRGLSIRVNERSVRTSVSHRPRRVPRRRHDRGRADGRGRCRAVRGEAERQGPHRGLHHAHRAGGDPHGARNPTRRADAASRVPTPEAGPAATGRAPDTSRRATQPASHAPWETGTGVRRGGPPLHPGRDSRWYERAARATSASRAAGPGRCRRLPRRARHRPPRPTPRTDLATCVGAVAAPWAGTRAVHRPGPV